MKLGPHLSAAGLLAALMLASPALGQDEKEGEPCARYGEVNDWAVDVWFQDDWLSDDVPLTLHHRFTHLPTGFVLLANVPQEQAREFGFGGIHDLLLDEGAQAQLADVTGTPGKSSADTNFPGALRISFRDPDTLWSWGAQGELTYGFSDLYGENTYQFSPDEEAGDPEELFRYLHGHGRSLIRMNLSFVTEDGNEITLREEVLNMLGISEVAGRITDAFVEEMVAACPLLEGN